ncbi:MAG: GNAT family N-acetyltransferase [Oscillospiraceae bacterium]|nr:GNAT family N-acetyltransferase [Oscillospiraceae bacterium]
MRIASLREEPARRAVMVDYFHDRFGNDKNRPLYADCLAHCTAAAPLPDWFLLLDGETPAGGCGLITNDFISRMDLWPWICALYVEPRYRGNACGALLLETAADAAKAAGFRAVYVCTDHTAYYERYGFHWIGEGYHPSGASSRIYQKDLV